MTLADLIYRKERTLRAIRRDMEGISSSLPTYAKLASEAERVEGEIRVLEEQRQQVA